MQLAHVVQQLADLGRVRLVQGRHGCRVREHARCALQSERAVGVDRHEQTEQTTDLLLEELLAVGFLQPLEANHDATVRAVPHIRTDAGVVREAHKRRVDCEVPGRGQGRRVAVQRAGQYCVGELDGRELEVDVLGDLLAPGGCDTRVDVILARDSAEHAARAAGEARRGLSGVADHLVADFDVADRLARRVGVARAVVDGREARRRGHIDGRVGCADRLGERRLGELEDVLLRGPLHVGAFDLVPTALEARLGDLLRPDEHAVGEGEPGVAEVETHLAIAQTLVVVEPLADLVRESCAEVHYSERGRADLTAPVDRVQPLRDDRGLLERALEHGPRDAGDVAVACDVDRVDRVLDLDDEPRLLDLAAVGDVQGDGIGPHYASSMSKLTRIASSLGELPVASRRSKL